MRYAAILGYSASLSWTCWSSDRCLVVEIDLGDRHASRRRGKFTLTYHVHHHSTHHQQCRSLVPLCLSPPAPKNSLNGNPPSKKPLPNSPSSPSTPSSLKSSKPPPLNSQPTSPQKTTLPSLLLPHLRDEPSRPTMT